MCSFNHLTPNLFDPALLPDEHEILHHLVDVVVVPV